LNLQKMLAALLPGHMVTVARSPVGGLIQSKAEMNLGAGPGVAVREFQTASGPVD
jgi:hypothetical protein